jgi:hypothetical protein
MNKERRNRINKVIEQLETLKDEISDISMEESEAYDNLPEGIQDSDRGEAMQEAIDNLDMASDTFDDIIEYLNEATQ